MTKRAQLEPQAPKGRKKTAQGNAHGNAGPEAQSPVGAAQRPSSHSTPSLRPLSSFLREPLRNGHSATASSDPDGIRTLTLTAVTVGDFSERNTKITSADARRVKDLWLEPGDILIQRSNAPELVGTSRLYRGGRNYAIFPDLMIRVRLNKEADPRFIELVLQSDPLRQYFKSRAKGMSGSMPKIDQETISEAPIPLFDIDVQRRIVAEIEKQFTRLEAGVAALRRVQANLKRYRAAVLKAACEGRLVPTEAELCGSGVPPLDPASTPKTPHSKNGTKVSANPKRQDAASTFESAQQLHARILTERRQNWQGRRKYKEPVELDTTKLFPLPTGWTWTTLDALAEIKGGITKDQNRRHTAPTRSVPYLRVANVQRGYIDLTEVKEILTTEDEISELALKTGDILFNEGGDRDKLGRGWVWNGQLPECIHQNHVFRARLYVLEMNPKLVSWYANTFGQKFFFDEGKHTTNLASISMSKLKSLPVPIPPPSEQIRIVAEVERRLSVVEELEAVVTTNLQRATRLRQSILQKAFTGQLTSEYPAQATPALTLLPKPATHKPPNRHFARALLSAEIVHRLHGEPTFGRTKHQKIFHLCEHIARIGEIGGQYHREAAGPLDNKLIYGNEAELKKQQWYAEVKRDSYGHAYQALPKAGAHRIYVERYWPEKLPMIEKLIELMRDWKTERCEIFCTAYAAWNDLLIQGQEPTDEAILHEILDCWHVSKKRIPAERWRKAIHWMKQEGWEPQGFGKPTKHLK